jgi:hypothetical protein
VQTPLKIALIRLNASPSSVKRPTLGSGMAPSETALPELRLEWAGRLSGVSGHLAIEVLQQPRMRELKYLLRVLGTVPIAALRVVLPLAGKNFLFETIARRG